MSRQKQRRIGGQTNPDGKHKPLFFRAKEFITATAYHRWVASLAPGIRITVLPESSALSTGTGLWRGITAGLLNILQAVQVARLLKLPSHPEIEYFLFPFWSQLHKSVINSSYLILGLIKVITMFTHNKFVQNLDGRTLEIWGAGGKRRGVLAGSLARVSSQTKEVVTALLCFIVTGLPVDVVVWGWKYSVRV